MSTWRSAPGDNEPRPINESLDRLTRRIGAPKADITAAVFAGWDDLVGPDLAAHARPESLRAGVLVLVADDPAWANQLQFMAADILARVRSAVGSQELTDLRIKIRHR
jgi:predicted nucleic acid-binding Zn ribbon protein